MCCKFLKSQVNPNFEALEAMNINKSVNQSVKATPASYRHRNKAAFYSTPETGAG